MKPREHSIEIVLRKTTFSVFISFFIRNITTLFLFLLFDLNWNTVYNLTVSKCLTFVTSILSGVRERSAMVPQVLCYGRKCLIYFLYTGFPGWTIAFNKARVDYSLPEHQSAQESQHSWLWILEEENTLILVHLGCSGGCSWLSTHLTIFGTDKICLWWQ